MSWNLLPVSLVGGLIDESRTIGKVNWLKKDSYTFIQNFRFVMTNHVTIS